MIGNAKDPLELGRRYAQIGGLAIAVLGLVTNTGFLEWVGLVIIVVAGLWSIVDSIVSVYRMQRQRHAAKKKKNTNT